MLQQMTKKAVEKLLTETNRALHVEDFKDVQDLDRVACRVMNVTPEEKRLLNAPFVLCGIRFYPLTLAKSLWYAEKCEEWRLEGIFQDVFLFWLLTLPLTDAVFDLYADRKDADKAVKRLSRRLHCTQAEMTEVFQKCVEKNSKTEPIRFFVKHPTEEMINALSETCKNQKCGEGFIIEFQAKQDDANYGGLIAMLLREYGSTPDYWLYEVPVETIGALVDQYILKVNAESEAHSKSAPSGKAPAPTARLKALRDFRIKLNEIKEKWNG